MHVADPTSLLHRPIEYDAVRRRLWVLGQRCHHGATGVVLAGAGLAGGLLGLKARTGVALASAGSLLMAHDWKDRGRWFEVGRGTQV